MAKSTIVKTIENGLQKELPVWVMRQAGRYLPEYLRISENKTFLEMCHDPDLAHEITMQPLQRFPLDAAIIFSDILTPLIPMGIDLDYIKNKGPVIYNPIRTMSDVKALSHFQVSEKLGYIKELLVKTRATLSETQALLGFCGSPFTLASYVIEGGSSKTYQETMKFFYNEPEASEALLTSISEHIVEYLTYQIDNGADAVQIFESTGGALSRYEFEQFALPYLRIIFEKMKNKGAKLSLYIHNGVHLTDIYELVGADIASIDWRIDIKSFRKKYPQITTQGNLNPSTLFAGPKAVSGATKRLIEDVFASGDQGHIFNLGHGILPQTPVESMQAFVETIKTAGR